MATPPFLTFFFLCVLVSPVAISNSINSCKQEHELDLTPIHLAKLGILHASNLVNQALRETATTKHDHKSHPNSSRSLSSFKEVALTDCLKLYENSESLLTSILSSNASFTLEDASAWLSSAWTSHHSCLDGLKQNQVTAALDELIFPGAHHRNLTFLLQDALASLSKQCIVTTPPLLNKSKLITSPSFLFIYLFIYIYI